MSENIQSDIINSKECDTNVEEVSSNLDYDKQLFVEKANTTFRELCRTLENEQNKLSELETRRKKLQEEMLLLKVEIEEEMKTLNVNIERSVAEKLNALNNAGVVNGKHESQIVSENLIHNNTLYTCREVEENPLVTVNDVLIKAGEKIIEEGTIE